MAGVVAVIRLYGMPDSDTVKRDNPHFKGEPLVEEGGFTERDVVDGLWDIPGHPYLVFADNITGYKASYSWIDGQWVLGAN